jgi:transcriptional regulator with GAF, ATPase, and Fis domain
VTALNEIVGAKLERFSKANTGVVSPVCLEVTKPEDQIKEIVTQIHNAIKFLSECDSIKVALAEIKEGKLSGTIYCAPRSHFTSSDDEQLNGETFFEKTLQLKKFNFIEDLEENFSSKKKKTYKYADGLPAVGSIIGFPIFKTGTSGKVRFILTIKSDEKIFGQNSEIIYGAVLRMFFSRIQLERQLIEIRQKYATCATRLHPLESLTTSSCKPLYSEGGGNEDVG